jgi:glucose-1-phosphate thymidylyltransferase
MWGILPAAGKGSRIQPLAFSKELLPISEREGSHVRHRAVSDCLVERLIKGGATRLCFVIAPGKSDILEYHGASPLPASICFTVQPQPVGLCDAIFRALPFIGSEESVLVGLPDTIWFPDDALRTLPDGQLAFLLFPVDHPEHFDAVISSPEGRVLAIQVKSAQAASNWIWGAFKAPASILRELQQLWLDRNRSDEYIGTLINAWLAQGGRAAAISAGSSYLDVGTLDAYLSTLQTLSAPGRNDAAAPFPEIPRP